MQLGAENPEASEALGNSASSLEESELPNESHVSCGAKRCWFYQIGRTALLAAKGRESLHVCSRIVVRTG